MNLRRTLLMHTLRCEFLAVGISLLGIQTAINNIVCAQVADAESTTSISSAAFPAATAAPTNTQTTAAAFDAASATVQDEKRAVEAPIIVAPKSLTHKAGNYATPIVALQPLGDEAPESIGDGHDSLPTDWDESDLSAEELGEDEMLRLSGREGDEAAFATDQLAIAPAHPVSIEELLSANRKDNPLFYKESVMDKGISQYSGELESALPSKDFRIESADFLDYDSETNLLYGSGGVVVRYGPYALSSERMVFDSQTREFQAAGNVILSNDTSYVNCESLRFNANTNQGVADGVRGRTGTLYFLGRPEKDGKFTFKQLSKDESLMFDAAVTTCDFPKPHVRVQAKEFTVVNEDRVLANNAVLYAGDIPVMWLPYFTWSLDGDNPWGGTIDVDSENGTMLRGWYHYYDEYETLDPLDESKKIKVADTHARLFADWFSSRGKGAGLDYTYSFFDGASRGDTNLYKFSDTKRVINGNKISDRYFYSGWNRTRLGKSNAEIVSSFFYPSDPDLFYDILDRFRSGKDPKRDRLMERYANFGVENTHDNWFLGFNYSMRDRIGRNRTTNYAEPISDDRDFDRGYNSESYFETLGGTLQNPYAGVYYDPLSYPGTLDKGIDAERYGRVSERYEANAATNRIKLSCLPLWYTANLNIFHNLDKGLNTVGTGDDAFVNGFDFYQALTHQLRLGERTTLVTQFGVGGGVAEREKDTFDLVPDDAVFNPYYITGGEWNNGILDGVRWVDKDTMLVGSELKSLKDVKRDFGYADVNSKLTTRLTNSITAYCGVRMRETTKDSLGDFYKEIGAVKASDDLYAFKTDEKWMESGLLFRSLIPRLNAQLSTGYNFESSSHHTPNELLGRTDLRMNWTNRIRTVSLSAGTALNEMQVRHNSDPNQFNQKSLEYSVSGRLNSRRKNMYARTSAVFINNRSHDDPLHLSGTSSSSSDLDNKDESVISFGVGREVGRKYLVEYTNNYRSRDSGDTEQFVTVSRDFHDIVASLGFGIKGGELSSDSENSEKDTWQFRFNMRFKKSSDMGLLPFTRSTSIYSQRGLGAFESGS